MSKQTDAALADTDLLSLLSAEGFSHDGVGLRDLVRVGLASRRGTRFYARRCSSYSVGRCTITGCETHDWARSVAATVDA